MLVLLLGENKEKEEEEGGKTHHYLHNIVPGAGEVRMEKQRTGLWPSSTCNLVGWVGERPPGGVGE